MLDYDISNRINKTKTEYLYECIKNDIRSGKLIPSEKLPSKRELASHLSVSVITVENAYIMLEEEGYIYARAGSGFYVGSGIAVSSGKEHAELTLIQEENSAGGYKNSQTAYFPAMARIIRRILSEQPEILQQKPPAFGCAVLRNALAKFLRRYRGMDAQPSNLIIGSGAEYLYGLTVQLFGRDEQYAVEWPSYEKIEKTYNVNGADTDHLKMGRDGVLSTELARTQAKVLHITPYHSYPTGVTAPAEKRFEYLAWANDRNGYIIEDDFDSEFAFYRKPIETLYQMDGGRRVIYMNTFTKSLSPAIRTAYMVLPDELLARFEERLGFYSCPVPMLEQYALADFIESGAFERHLGRIRRSRGS